MKILQPFFAAMLAAAPVAAQGVPPAATPLVADGLGQGGQAFQWNWLKSKIDIYAPAMVHIFLQTGEDPEPYGWVTAHLDPAMFPQLTDGTYPRPLCSAGMAWTGSEYTPPGYRNPEPIGIAAVTGQYSAPAAGQTINVWWSSPAFLPAHTAYSIILTCGSKAGHRLAPAP